MEDGKGRRTFRLSGKAKIRCTVAFLFIQET
jgi:hypothetical protein